MTVRKQSSMPKRKKALKRSKAPRRSTRKVPTVNKAAAKRKLARYQAFMQSKAWANIRADALIRAGFRCEYRLPLALGRCAMRDRLEVHHRVYTRYGGKELPKDLQVLCHDHHALVESQKPGIRLWMRARS